MLLALALATVPTRADLPTPNYAATLLSPMENSAVPPRLVPTRRTRPIRVGVVLRAEMVNEERLEIVRAACGQWEQATRLSEVALRFVFVRYQRPGDADVVFNFRGMGVGSELKGLTVERAGWAAIDLAVEDSERVPFPRRDVLRVATHELGHALGIWGHSPDAHDVMSLDAGATEITLADVNTLRIAYWPGRSGPGRPAPRMNGPRRRPPVP